MKSNSEDQNTYDIIITGAGAAGLSLVYYLLQSNLSQSKILIIDKDKKEKNDRTWCFWTKELTGLEEIIYKKWDKVIFKNKTVSKELKLDPYQYQMIRGIDFYQFIKSSIDKHPNVHWVKEEVIDIFSEKGLAIVDTNKSRYNGNLLFNSIPIDKPEKIPKKNNYLLQHFKGYIVETKVKFFDTQKPYLMDFSVEQKSETRFGYVLPFSETKALVEFTLFSKEILEKEEYNSLLSHYLDNHLKIPEYSIEEEEFGVIPMTDINFTFNPEENIYNIGTLGGMTKASTGYTFKRILDETKAIVNSLENRAAPTLNSKARFRFYDSVLLHVLAENLHPADDIFSDLFLRNKNEQIFKFLDEETNIAEDLKILGSLPSIPFLKGAFKTFFYTGLKKTSS